MKQALINVPHGGRIIITGEKPKVNPRQLSLFDRLRESWLASMLAHVNQHQGTVRISDIRVEANIEKLSAPAHENWWGSLTKCMKRAGWYVVGYDLSPIKSRKGGTERLWQRRAA